MADAADWVMVNECDNYAVNVDSIKKVGNDKYEAWFKAELKNDVLVKKAEMYSFFDCTGRRIKALKTIRHFRDGSTSETGERELEDVPPDSILESVLKTVCSYQKGIASIPEKGNGPDNK